MTQPLFSVVVPTRNRLETAKEAIASVLGQTHRDFELIVSDNSTSSGRELEDWLRARPDLPTRFEYIRTGGDLEMDVNWETASKRARGRYLLVLPDRWVMRGGVLSLLASVVARDAPECVFWDSKLSIRSDGRFQSDVDTNGPVRCDIRMSQELLENLLSFEGYASGTVYTQPFPRGLNCITRSDVVRRVRQKVGILFAPNACDYTSGVSILLNTDRLVHLRDSLYLAIGSDSNGQRLSVYGVPPHLREATRWRGLELDTVLLTVMRDLEATLARNGAAVWSDKINVPNLLLSLLNEIHFKEWHGSPLDTGAMRAQLVSYAQRNADTLGAEVVEKMILYDRQFAPRMRPARRLLQRMNLFYKLYELKHLVLGKIRPSPSGHRYSDDLLSARPLQVADTAGSH